MSTDVGVCFCTLAIHAPYRRRARLLCADAARMPWVVLTDEPEDFADLNVRAIRHAPTGPMAVDYLTRLPTTGRGRGAAAYHDKRFALLAALEDHDTAIYLDADSRLRALPSVGTFPFGISVVPSLLSNISSHLAVWGTWRRPIFEELATYLTGSAEILDFAQWCPESVIGVTKDGKESRFFEAWTVCANFFQRRDIYSGEGGVIGLAAACAGWTVDYEALKSIAGLIQHEGGGPKRA